MPFTPLVLVILICLVFSFGCCCCTALRWSIKQPQQCCISGQIPHNSNSNNNNNNNYFCNLCTVPLLSLLAGHSFSLFIFHSFHCPFLLFLFPLPFPFLHPFSSSFYVPHLPMSVTATVTEKPLVLIVGAGLGGLTLGALLEKANIPYQILERIETIKSYGNFQFTITRDYRRYLLLIQTFAHCDINSFSIVRMTKKGSTMCISAPLLPLFHQLEIADEFIAVAKLSPRVHIHQEDSLKPTFVSDFSVFRDL